MTIYTSGLIGPDQSTLESFDTSAGEALGAAVKSTYQGNISTVAQDAADLYQANTGKDIVSSPTLLHTALFGLGGAAYDMYQNLRAPDTTKKVDKATAEQQVKDAGVPLTIPEQGYSQAALDLLIKRKRDTLQTDDILNRAPQGLGNMSMRFAASLATSLVDPINIASAFVPVIGEARYAELLAGAGGLVGRTAIRTGIGAAEGAAGAAILEPAIYAGRTQLQDDYTMANSLENIAFGAAFGGGLHAVGGAVGERFNTVTGRPQSWERAANDANLPNNTEPALATENAIPGADSNQFSDEAFRVSSQIDTGQLSVEQFSRLYDENPDLAKQVVELHTGDRPVLDTAPRAQGLSIESAKAQAMAELTPTFRAELTAAAGNLADKGTIAELKARQTDIQQKLDAITGDPQAAFKEVAKDLQGTGLSRKQAETAARKQLADQETELNAQFEAVGQQIDTNAKAQQATNDLARLDQGQTPDYFTSRIEDRANQLIGRRNLIDAVALPSEASARFIVSNVSPEIRRSALSAAVSQMAQGRIPDVESIIRLDNKDPQAVAKLTETARRTQQPESSATGDAAIAKAAQERLQQAPKTTDYQAAESAMTKAVDRLNATVENIEQSHKPKLDINAAEVRLREKINTDFAGAVSEYNQRPDAMGGKVLNTDIARELSPDYLKNRALSADVHEPASAFVKKLYAQKLKEAPKKGEDPLVMFTAGGTGAGKTSALEQLGGADNAQIIYDTNMNKYASAKTKVEQALKAGKDVRIVAVYRDPVEALVNGALPRAMRQEAKFGSGRTVPLAEQFKTHIGFPEVIVKLADEYNGDPRVKIEVIDNSRGKGNAAGANLDLLRNLEHNQLADKLSSALEQEYAKGNISKAVYDGFKSDTGRPSENGQHGRGDAKIAEQPAGRSSLSQEITRELANADALVANAEAYGKALRAAALCGIRS